MVKQIKKLVFKNFLIFIVISVLGIGFGSRLINKNQLKNTQTPEKNTPKAFVSEVYDKIKENYWNNVSDADLLNLFKLSIEKNGGQTDSKFENKDNLLSNIINASKALKGENKNKFIASVVGTVLASLSPPGRSGLYTQQLETQLKNTVENVNPNIDLYKDLGVGKGASQAAVEQAYQKKSKDLSQDKSPEAKEKLKQISYAKDVLSKDDTKKRYDSGGVEPTIFTKVISPETLYLQFKKFSPTSYDEFIKAFDSFKNDSALSSLIFDLRGNIGGAIDSTAFYLGNFLGKNSDAFSFYHKGEYLPFKTPTEKLASISKYKQVVILVDNQTQSSAEMMAASLKKYHVGVILGVPTKGWGTVEKVFPLDNQYDNTQKYSLFLVHSITLRDDNQPIEGRGVDPDINIKDKDWEAQLFSYFRNNQLNEAIKSIL